MEVSTVGFQVIERQVPCRICGRVGLNSVLSHDGEPVVSDSRWPIDLTWCPACSLVQWTETVTNDEPDHAGGSFGREEAARLIVDRLRETRHLGPDSLVIEIAGNGPDLLQRYLQAGVPVLSIGPAGKPPQMAQSSVPSIGEEFGAEMALQLVRTNQRADVIHAGGTFAQLEDLNGVVAGLATLIKPEGMVVVAVPYLKDLAEHVGFNTFGREELCYFSLTSLTQLFGQHGLEIVDVEHMKTQGGVLRIFATRFGTMSVTESVHEMMADESGWVRDPEFYQSFGETLVLPSHDRWAA